MIKIKVMNILPIITALFFIISCNQSVNIEKKPLNTVGLKQKEQSKIDSVVVVYWKNTEANEYQFNLSHKLLRIRSKYFGFKKSVENKQSIQMFFEYINNFYVNKEPIIITKKKEPAQVSDYPIIEVIVFLKGQKIFEEKISLYSNIEFSPKFIEFYHFLDDLISTK